MIFKFFFGGGGALAQLLAVNLESHDVLESVGRPIGGCVGRAKKKQWDWWHCCYETSPSQKHVQAEQLTFGLWSQNYELKDTMKQKAGWWLISPVDSKLPLIFQSWVI